MFQCIPRGARLLLEAARWAGAAVVALVLAETAHAATVTPAGSTAYLPNPGIGFQAMQDLSSPALPETVAYRRPQYAWNEQNPAQGVYDWSEVDADLAAAVALGKQFSMRIYTMRGEGFGGHKVPAWVVAEGAEILGSGMPLYSNCVYQQRWGEFVEAMRQRYDGNPDIAFIDISGYGNFNEWSWQPQTEWDDDALDPTTLDGQARKRLADMFLGGAGTVECTLDGGGTQMASYSYPGFQQTQLLMPYAGIQQSTRYVAWRRGDVGFREDCLGSPGHTDSMLEKVGDVIAATWSDAPVVYELCGVEDLASAREVLEATHGSLVHENGGGNDVGDFMATLLDAGYRMTVTQATFPDQSLFTGSIDVDVTWRNVGLAPAYAAMGQDFEARAYLLEADGDVAAQWTLPGDPNGWLPADPYGATPPDQGGPATLVLPMGLHLASYDLAVAIHDLRTGANIALANAGTDAERRLVLGAIQFSDGEVCGDGLQRPDLGELCDDGNNDPGDCCSPTCTLEAGPCDDGDPCTTADTCSAAECLGGPPLACDDGIACTSDSCTAGVGCTAEPVHALCDDAVACTADTCVPGTGCTSAPDDSLCDDGNLCTQDDCDDATLECEFAAQPAASCAAADAATFGLSDANGNEKLSWSWKNGTVDAGLLGDPVADDGAAYALCVYSGSTLAMGANAPAGTGCGATSSCWKATSSGFAYKSLDSLPDGVSSVVVKSGRPGRDRVQVKGRYSPLAVPGPAVPGMMFDPAFDVTVQAVNSLGACWGATFSSADIRTNTADVFRAARK